MHAVFYKDEDMARVTPVKKLTLVHMINFLRVLLMAELSN